MYFFLFFDTTFYRFQLIRGCWLHIDKIFTKNIGFQCYFSVALHSLFWFCLEFCFLSFALFLFSFCCCFCFLTFLCSFIYLYIYIYTYVWKLNKTVLELDIWAVNFLFCFEFCFFLSFALLLFSFCCCFCFCLCLCFCFFFCSFIFIFLFLIEFFHFLISSVVSLNMFPFCQRLYCHYMICRLQTCHWPKP